MALWMYSSGSTGRPKGIVHLHHDVAYIQKAFGHHVLKLRADDRCFSVPKMYFAYGFGNSLIFPFSVGATTILLAGQPRPAAVLDAIEAYRPTVLFGLPTLYTALANSDGIAQRDLTSLRQSMSAAEILSQEVYSPGKTSPVTGRRKAWAQRRCCTSTFPTASMTTGSARPVHVCPATTFASRPQTAGPPDPTRRA
jgi:acyl-coenzyme A synthetase/AMP-(fatty) acid ligase